MNGSGERGGGVASTSCGAFFFIFLWTFPGSFSILWTFVIQASAPLFCVWVNSCQAFFCIRRKVRKAVRSGEKGWANADMDVERKGVPVTDGGHPGQKRRRFRRG